MRESKNIKCDLSKYKMRFFHPEEGRRKKLEKDRFSVFFKVFSKIAEEKSKQPQKRKRAGKLNMYFFFTSP